jgi:proteic killer suppression protein
MTMEVDFINDRLKKVCEDKSARQRAYQKDAADKLATRLDDLRAADNMEAMRHLPGSWEELTGDRKGQFSCRLDKKLRLIVRPKKQPPPMKGDGGLDWRAIDSITVLEVVNYHD